MFHTLAYVLGNYNADDAVEDDEEEAFKKKRVRRSESARGELEKDEASRKGKKKAKVLVEVEHEGVGERGKAIL
ncbi:hypothetical protein HS088_TW19G00493 [Tripterygium wilfordii]|uniref:Uncharacterized protein n=1 Tax=Tripterygium wilfordii TaxID=458696 RepID=A0A7J7C9P4_TRIWF|nr:hypothetical protein HS088_TW19G00493 [Tripterygium wilfordii]